MKTSTKLMLIAMLALAAGGTCPSDVNNDGTVGINDFLAVLGDWGPCPSATVVDLAAGSSTDGLLVRISSDGLAEYRVLHSGALPEWVALPDNPDAPLSRPVAIAHLTSDRFYRQWADGSVDVIDLFVNCGSKEGVCMVTIEDDWMNL